MAKKKPAKKRAAKKRPVKKAKAKKKAPPKLKPNHGRTYADVARHFGVAYGTVASRWRQSGMPVEADGTYDYAKIGKWRELRIANQPHVRSNGKGGHTGDDLADNPAYRRKLIDAEIKQQELEKRRRENARAAGDYVPRHDVQVFFSALLSQLRDDLARIPSELKASFPSDLRAELEDQLKARLNLCLETIYRQRNKIEEIAKGE
jgi:phage terminase Nu1 subunit (DNA packaging protein)